MVEITMKNGGVIRIELDEKAAPLSVANFEKLAKEGFYDGLIFHRIISGFMIQGGDPDGTGMGGPDTRVKGEFASNGWDNPLKHTRGTLSMARSQDPDSAGSQFFIVHQDSEFLDGNYAAFGKVVEGMDVVDEIAAVPTNPNDRPLQDVVMETVRIID
ncbi:peptidylprolyl isomerase [Ruminococcaceae bacterium OttesenSCG-928-A16]|nr:peptidylprolyl isomerase [Ruminococcaceae bacterium OttesenSCG-928-A16]